MGSDWGEGGKGERMYPAARKVRSCSAIMSSAKLLDLIKTDMISTCSSPCTLMSSFFSRTSCCDIDFRALVMSFSFWLSFHGSLAITQRVRNICAAKNMAFSVVGSRISS